MGESHCRGGAGGLTKLCTFRDTQQTARFLSSQAKRLDVLDVSASNHLIFVNGDRDGSFCIRGVINVIDLL